MKDDQGMPLATQPGEMTEKNETEQQGYISEDTWTKVLQGDAYRQQTELCVKLFNRLIVTLGQEQKDLLFAYDEAIAVKESYLLYGICGTRFIVCQNVCQP